MRLPHLVSLLALAASPALAQSNAQLMANDHYTRSHDYDLIHQKIEVWNFNWDSTSFDGRVTTTLVALRPGLDSLILDAGAKLRIAKVTSAAGATLRTAAHGDTLVVFLAKPAGFGDTARFTIAYHGVVENGRGLTYIQTEGRKHRPQQIWSQGEDHDNHYWFPTYDFPNDKMTWEVVATVPASYTAVSNGRLVSQTKSAAGTVFDWNQDTPSATYLVSLIVAPLAKIHDEWSGIPVDYYVYHEDSALAWPLFHQTTDMIGTYSRLTGVRYPWAKYAETTVADFFGGMENVSATTLIDPLPDPRAYLDRPWYGWILIPHELSHQWFGDYVTTVNWANMWLNEGFAEFMPGQYWLAKQGAHAEQDYYVDEYNQFMAIDHDRRMPLASLGSNNIYPKGALVLEMLKHYLGEQAFWASVHRYLTDHAYGNATSDDLRQAVLQATGQDLDWFWNEWVYDAGYPEFSVTASYDATKSAVTLDVKQTQADSAKPDSTGLRYETPQVFRMPVTVRVGTTGGDVVQRFDVTAREETLTVTGVKSAPTMVVFDDGNDILKALDFLEPTAWLATQLKRDPDLWNRSWVLDQLAARKEDTAAVAALAWAATSSDYNLTRADAAEKLAIVPADAAIPALTAVLKDTSATVRAGAVRALGNIADPRATTLLRQTWTGDASYEVRAAAVAALGQSDTAGRHAVFIAALATPSYQDAIAGAALRGIARSGDTTLIDSVAARLADQRIAAHVLAAMGNRGATRALDVLFQHLDEDRAGVRRWVLEACRFTLRPELGIPRLQAAVGGLKHADTKDAATSLIADLQKRAAKP